MTTPQVLPILPLNTEGQELTSIDESSVSAISISSKYNTETDYIQAYLYDVNDNLISRLTTNYSVTSGKISGSSTSQINLDPAQDLASNNYIQGIYKINYNFLNNLIVGSPTFNIVEISSDRTELRVSNSSLDPTALQAVANTLTNFLNSTETFQGFDLDFGSDTLLLATNVGFDGTAVLIKLYQPLPSNLGTRATFNFVEKKSEPVAYRVEYPQEELPTAQQIYLKGPNLNIQAQQETNNSTEFQTIDSIYGSSDINLTNQLNSILVERRAELNTDYTNFSNFAFFSSVEQRLINFYEKASLIENYNSQITSLNTIPNSTEASSSKAVYQSRINDLVTNFDGYDYFLYFDSGSQSWPKSNSTQPYTLYSTGSSQVINWYSTQLTSASFYDEQNQNYIYNIYPQYITEDSDNDQFKLFNEMVAQMFDQIWLYTQAVQNRQDGDNRLSEGISIDLAADALRSYGITLYESNLSNNDLYTTYLGINTAGGTLPPTGSEWITNYVTASAETTPFSDAQKLVYKRLYHNLPYLLKKKGTVAGLQLLIDCFGVPDTLLRIYEYGGKDKKSNTWDQWQNEFNYAFNTEGTNYISSSFALNSTWNASNNRPQAVEFRFQTRGIPTPAYYSQSLWSTDTLSNLILTYSGSGYSSGSYSGSVVNPYNQYGKLELIPDPLSPSVSASIYLPFFNEGWWSVLINKVGTVYSLYAKNSVYEGQNGNTIGFQASSSVDPSTQVPWNNATISYFATSSYSAKIFSGSIQEVRYYTTALSESSFNDYVMNASSTRGNYVNATPEQLAFRATLGGELYTGSVSVHPKVSGTQVTISSFSSTSNFNYKNTPTFIPNNEVVFYDQVLGGIKNTVSNKIKSGESTVYGKVLSGLTSLQQNYPASQSYTNDVNYMEVGFSPANEINEDINSQLGYINIGEYIGDPRFISQASYTYPELNTLSLDYFKKYGSSYDLQDYFRLIKYFDNSLFKMIKDFIPARASVATGAIVKQHLLERNRQRPAQVSYSQPEYTASITSLARDYQTGSIEVFTGGAGGSVNVLTNLTQSWTSSILTKAGLVTEIESSQYEFFNGEYSGSVIDVIQGNLQDNPLLGAAYRVSIPDLQNLNVSSNTAISSSGLNNNSIAIPFKIQNTVIDYYNTTTSYYTPRYSVQADFNIYYTASIQGTGSSQADLAIQVLKDGVAIGQVGLARISVPFNSQFSGSLIVPNEYITSGSNYSMALAEVGAGVFSTITASFNSATTWTVTVDNLAAQSTYYLDPTVYTQQNFPGDINDFTDYNSLLNNVYSNRTSNTYYDVDYSEDALNPVNFQTIISQSAIYAQIQDSNYTSGSVWTTARYGGTKNTGQYNTTINFSSESLAPDYPVDKFSNYFARFSYNTTSNPEYPGGGLFKLVELINVDGTRIPLTGDNKYVSFVSEVFKAGKTVTAYGRDVSVVKTVTDLQVIEGGAYYQSILYKTGSVTAGFAYSLEVQNPTQVNTGFDTALSSSSPWTFVTDDTQGTLFALLTGSSTTQGNINSIATDYESSKIFNRQTGTYAPTSTFVSYGDTYLPLQYGDFIRFGSGSVPMDSTPIGRSLNQYLSASIGNELQIGTVASFIYFGNAITSPLRNTLDVVGETEYRIFRRIPDETWVVTVSNPNINTDPAIGGLLIPEDFNPDYDPITIARQAGIEL